MCDINFLFIDIIRHYTSLPFPVVDSFPAIYESFQNGKPWLSAKTSLSTAPVTGTRLTWLVDRVKSSFDVSEREDTINSLIDIAENYSTCSNHFDEDST